MSLHKVVIEFQVEASSQSEASEGVAYMLEAVRPQMESYDIVSTEEK